MYEEEEADACHQERVTFTPGSVSKLPELGSRNCVVPVTVTVLPLPVAVKLVILVVTDVWATTGRRKVTAWTVTKSRTNATIAVLLSAF
jgi:hypothetical protein